MQKERKLSHDWCQVDTGRDFHSSVKEVVKRTAEMLSKNEDTNTDARNEIYSLRQSYASPNLFVTFKCGSYRYFHNVWHNGSFFLVDVTNLYAMLDSSSANF